MLAGIPWSELPRRRGPCSGLRQGKLRTNATAGIVYNSLGPQGTFTNRVQDGFGQAVVRRG
jgi:hypothetical protein